jgi:hypothetical protein
MGDRMRCVLTALLIAISFSLARADIFTPSHSCSKPYKPYRFTSQWELDSFRDDVRRYKSCIEEFIEEQEAAIKKHRGAANEAIEEWNNFVRLELR